MRSLDLEVGLLGLRVGAVPDGGVVVALSWDHDGCHDGSDVECRPFGHKLFHQSFGREVLVASFPHFLFHWYSPGVSFRIGVISIVVCLDQEPINLI